MTTVAVDGGPVRLIFACLMLIAFIPDISIALPRAFGY